MGSRELGATYAIRDEGVAASGRVVTGTPLVGTSLPCPEGGVRVEFSTDKGTYIGSVRIFATNPTALLVMLDETRKFLESSLTPATEKKQ